LSATRRPSEERGSLTAPETSGELVGQTIEQVVLF
jgi:hypothetical protein